MTRCDFFSNKRAVVHSPVIKNIPMEALRAGFDERHNVKVVVVDVYDLQRKIESYEKQCDIHEIAKRYALTNDLSLLNFNPQLFGQDGILVPRDLRSVFSAINGAKDYFSKLSQDEAKKYKNFEDFLSKIPNHFCDIYAKNMQASQNASNSAPTNSNSEVSK